MRAELWVDSFPPSPWPTSRRPPIDRLFKHCSSLLASLLVLHSSPSKPKYVFLSSSPSRSLTSLLSCCFTVRLFLLRTYPFHRHLGPHHHVPHPNLPPIQCYCWSRYCRFLNSFVLWFRVVWHAADYEEIKCRWSDCGSLDALLGLFELVLEYLEGGEFVVSTVIVGIWSWTILLYFSLTARTTVDRQGVITCLKQYNKHVNMLILWRIQCRN